MTGNIVVGHGGGISLSRAPSSAGPDPETASAVVTGAGDAGTNLTYPRDGSRNGRALFTETISNRTVSWEGAYWAISASGFSTLYYYSEEDVAYPWLAITWQAADADEPVPTVAMG